MRLYVLPQLLLCLVLKGGSYFCRAVVPMSGAQLCCCRSCTKLCTGCRAGGRQSATHIDLLLLLLPLLLLLLLLLLPTSCIRAVIAAAAWRRAVVSRSMVAW